MSATTYKVEFVGGGTVSGESRPSDLIAFERRYQVPGWFLGDQDNARIEYLWFMAWRAVTRNDSAKVEFDEWIEMVDSVEVEGDDEPVTPAAVDADGVPVPLDREA